MSQLAKPAAAAVPSQPPPDGIIRRGIKKPSPLGTGLFVALRALDVPLQYKLLSGAWSVPLLSRLGLAAAAPVVSPTAAVHSGMAAVDRLGLSAPGLLLLAMAAGSAAKHSYWVVALSLEEFLPSTAVVVSAFNAVFNSLNSLLLVAAATSASTAVPCLPIPFSGGASVPLPMAVGVAVYALGMFLELGSEIQRRRFKDRKENKGLVCRTGLWGMARHVNYGGYTLWRSGYSLAAGGWVAGTAAAAFNAWSFINMGTVELDEYMSGRYGEQWARYKREVKWLLLPGIY